MVGQNCPEEIGKDRRNLRSLCESRWEQHSKVLQAADLSVFKDQRQGPENTGEMSQPVSGDDSECRCRHKCDGG